MQRLTVPQGVSIDLNQRPYPQEIIGPASGWPPCHIRRAFCRASLSRGISGDFEHRPIANILWIDKPTAIPPSSVPRVSAPISACLAWINASTPPAQGRSTLKNSRTGRIIQALASAPWTSSGSKNFTARAPPLLPICRHTDLIALHSPG